MSNLILGFGFGVDVNLKDIPVNFFQTYKFSKFSIDSFIDDPTSCDVLLCKPANPWPQGPLFIGGGRSLLQGESNIKFNYIPYINIKVFRELSRFIYVLTFILLRFKHYRRVFVYSSYSPFILVAFILRYFSGSYVCGFFTDAPGVTLQTDNLLVRIFKAVERSFMPLLFSIFARSCVLSEHFAKKYLNNHVKVIPGVIDDIVPTHKVSSNMIRLVYAGSLNKGDNLLRFAKSLSYLDLAMVELHIFGFGSESFALEQFAKTSNRVYFHGSCENSVVLDFYRQCDYGLMLRDPALSSANMGFPSKLFEYLAHRLIPVVTPLKSIPDDFLDSFVVTGLEFEEVIKRIVNFNDRERAQFHNKCDMLRNKFNYRNQLSSIRDFFYDV